MNSTDLYSLLNGTPVLDLAHPYAVGMPQSPNHPPFRMLLERRHGDQVRDDGASAANEMIVLGGHVGTHVDALAHVSQDGELYGGITAQDVQGHRGFEKLGIEEFTPYLGRAVLLDIARLKGVGHLPGGYEITVEDLEAALDATGHEIGSGDVVLLGTGWSRLWPDPAVFAGQVGGAPGPGVAAARWLADFGPRAIGAETIAFECIKPGAGHALLPVHRVLLVENGINIIETMNLDALLESGRSEFLLSLSPLSITGATGAPVRPFAVLV